MKEPKKPMSWVRFYQWVRKHHKVVLIALGALVLSAGATTAFLVLTHKPTVKSKPVAVVKPVEKPKPEPIKYYSPLTGIQVADEAATKQPVTGVMIENSPEARPQSGLKNSGVVFEAIAEGGITRFLVLYQSEKPQLIGPVRSVRIYYVDWLAAFDASVAHVGGSAAALAEVRNGNYFDLDQFFNSGTYWRSTDRYAPHNVYTSFANLDALNTAKGHTSSTFTGFPRIDGKPSATPNATNISVIVSSELFNSTYAYNAKTNSYDRSQAGAPHLDREDGQISPNVVIAMHVDEKPIMEEDGYHEDITAIGSGNATIFQNGTAINAVWTKSSKTDQIKLTDAAGTEIPLVRGQTWIVAVPNNGGDVSWS